LRWRLIKIEVAKAFSDKGRFQQRPFSTPGGAMRYAY
jgi:hypothetical protein